VIGDFVIDDSSKGRSGVGAAVRGAAHARADLSQQVSLVARLAGDASLYRDKRFNDIIAELSAGPEVRLGRTRLSLDLGAGQQWHGMKPYQRSLRAAGSATFAVDSVSQARVDGALRWTDNRVNDLQDGRGWSLRGRYERAISPQLSLSASLATDRFDARDDAYSTRSWLAGISAHRDIGRMTVSAGAEVGRLKGDERLALLPEARDELFTRFSLGAVARQFTVAGFAPVAKVTIERNRSNVAFYDYRRTRTEFGISRAF
jgi:outer membrane protein